MSIRILILLIGVCCHVHAQQNSTVIGARVNGLGNAASCIQDISSTFSNPAGLASIKISQTFFTYDNVPAFPTFNRMAAAITIPTTFGVGGVGLYRFGDDLYNEQILSAVFANKLGLASLGIRGNVVQYNAEGYGRKHVMTLSMGGLVEFTKWLSVGAYIININQPEIESGQRVPTRLYLGVAAKLSSTCFATAEIEKDLDFEPTIKAGMEYEIYRKISIRTGANLFPSAGFAGLGFKPTRFQLDYAFSFIPMIGARHQASVNYQFRKIKK